MQKINIRKDILFVVFAALFAFFCFQFLHFFFQQTISDFTVEILAATIGAIFTVTAMMVVMRIQSSHEKNTEFSKRLFDTKIELYKSILETIFKIDDDNVIDKSEIQQIENEIGVAALVANAKLVSGFSQFICQLKIYGCLYPRSMSPRQITHFVSFFSENPNYLSLLFQQNSSVLAPDNFEDYFVSLDTLVQLIREDLSVVEGNIEAMLEHFVELPMDKFELMRNPNQVD